MQRDDEAKHEMRYIDVVKVSAGKRGVEEKQSF